MVPPSGRLFGGQRPSLHAVLGGGKVADVVLWREKRIPGAILIGIAAIWFLLEIVEYNLVTLLCHFTITTMLLIFISSSAAQFFNWNPPDIPQIYIEDSNWREIGSIFNTKLNDLLFTLMYVGCGYDHKLFLLTIVSLWMISIIGSSTTTLNLLFLGVVLAGTIPLVYEKYDDEVDNLAYQLCKGVKKMYNFFEAEILGKIPRKNRNN